MPIVYSDVITKFKIYVVFFIRSIDSIATVRDKKDDHRRLESKILMKHLFSILIQISILLESPFGCSTIEGL